MTEMTDLLNELIGEVCVCGRGKRPRETFCRGCYYSLPTRMRKDLYKRMGQGYEEARRAAVKCLGLEEDSQ